MGPKYGEWFSWWNGWWVRVHRLLFSLGRSLIGPTNMSPFWKFVHSRKHLSGDEMASPFCHFDRLRWDIAFGCMGGCAQYLPIRFILFYVSNLILLKNNIIVLNVQTFQELFFHPYIYLNFKEYMGPFKFLIFPMWPT